MISLPIKPARRRAAHAVALTLAAATCTTLLLAQASLQTRTLQPPTKSTTPTPRPSPPTQARNLTPTINRNVIVLDPAHGGAETGGKLADQSLEKDVTLALASRLRPTLVAAGFTVLSTRDADVTDALSTDQRAEFANRQHAAACLILHASSTGSGIHLYISSLQPTPPPSDLDPDTRPPFEPILWNMAQAGTVTQSLHLQTELATSLQGAGLPTLRGRGPVRPLDNLTCPAVIIELAPLAPAGGSVTAITDGGYQQRLADSVTAALGRWRDSLPVRQKTAPAAPALHPPVPAGAPQ